MMKATLMLMVLTLMAVCPVAEAYSPLIEISKRSLRSLPLDFEIDSKRLANGDVEFAIKIREKTFKLDGELTTALAKVHVEGYSMQTSGVRPLPAERNERELLCIFTVTKKEMEDPDLSFYFRMSGNTKLPVVDHFYAPLRNYLP